MPHIVTTVRSDNSKSHSIEGLSCEDLTRVGDLLFAALAALRVREDFLADDEDFGHQLLEQIEAAEGRGKEVA